MALQQQIGLERTNAINQNKNGIGWYLSFKEPLEECEQKIQIEEKKKNTNKN